MTDTNKPEVVLPELPVSVARIHSDGYWTTDDRRPDWQWPSRQDVFTADQLRAYGQACIDTLTRPADGEFGWRPIADAQLLVRDATGCSGPCAVLLKLNIARPGPFIRQGRFDIAAGGFVCDSTAQVLHDAVAFIEPQWAAPSAAPQQHGQEVGGEFHECPHCKGWSRTSAQQPAEAVAWRSPDEVPTVPAGGMDFFWVAVRRQHNGKVYSFPAAYLNSMSLDNDDFPIEQVRQGNRYVEVPPGEHDDGCMVATGWYSAKEHSDYDTLYSALLDSTDELVAWRPVSDYPNTAQPPAIDIGKLRELVERWRNLDTDFAAYKGCADELAALIGGGGERV